MKQVQKDVSVIVLTKGCCSCTAERYVWIFRQWQHAEVIRSAGRMAANPELTLSWYDAACIAGKLKAGANQ